MPSCIEEAIKIPGPVQILFLHVPSATDIIIDTDVDRRVLSGRQCLKINLVVSSSL